MHKLSEICEWMRLKAKTVEKFDTGINSGTKIIGNMLSDSKPKEQSILRLGILIVLIKLSSKFNIDLLI